MTAVYFALSVALPRHMATGGRIGPFDSLEDTPFLRIQVKKSASPIVSPSVARAVLLPLTAIVPRTSHHFFFRTRAAVPPAFYNRQSRLPSHRLPPRPTPTCFSLHRKQRLLFVLNHFSFASPLTIPRPSRRRWYESRRDALKHLGGALF